MKKVEHLTLGFAWGSPQELHKLSAKYLEEDEKRGYELIHVEVLSGFCILYMKRAFPQPPETGEKGKS